MNVAGLSLVERCIIEFGKQIRQLHLADIVIDIYDAALQETSRAQYKTGQRAYMRFINQIEPKGYLLPFPRTRLQKTELVLAFFMASLVTKPSITKAATILNYETHVKWHYRREGCQPCEYQTPFLKQVRKGLRKMLPSRQDLRAAFLLPKYVFMGKFSRTNQQYRCLLRFATIMGFVGMLRPHTYRQLQPAAFTVVIEDGEGRLPPQLVNARDVSSFSEKVHEAGDAVLGFFIKFKSKTMLDATAYFPRLSNCARRFEAMCPVMALKDLITLRAFGSRFLKNWGNGISLSSYLKQLAGDEIKVSPHALRIGGRTWYLSKNLDKQFVDFLGTWACPEASARYYRASPAAVLRRLQEFYAQLTDWDAIN